MATNDDTEVAVIRESQGEIEVDPKPIVLNYKKFKNKSKNKNRGRRYSRDLKDIQLLGGDATHIGQKAVRALSKSIDTYENERQRSGKRKKDGAVKDYLQNVARATSTYMKESADIPVDLADSARRLSKRNNLRKNLRRISRNLRLWPF